jgi:Raf kinase inhibitor-like YbhB/YbcL family protein
MAQSEIEMKVRSPAFASDQPIPKRYTADGENISPPLEWSGVPHGTKEVAVIVDDPDAPSAQPFAHWLMYHIPPDTTRIPEGASPHNGDGEGLLPVGVVQGRNSFRSAGYGGPAPPRGNPHHYHFAVYALDAPLDVDANADRETVLESMQGHVLAKGELVGTYQR